MVLLGPFDGVMIITLCGAASSLLQPCFVTTGLSLLLTEYFFSGGHVPALEGWQWLGSWLPWSTITKGVAELAFG